MIRPLRELLGLAVYLGGLGAMWVGAVLLEDDDADHS